MTRLTSRVAIYVAAGLILWSAACFPSTSLAQRIKLVNEQRPSVDWSVEQADAFLVTRSPNLLYVYAPSSGDHGIHVLAEHEDHKSFRVVQRLVGLMSKRRRAGEVTETELLDGGSISWFVPSLDGRHLYAADTTRSTMIRFERDPKTGLLTPPATGDRRDLSQDPTTGRRYPPGRIEVGKYLVNSFNDAAFDPTGRYLYVSSLIGTLAIFERDAETGVLTFRHVFADEKLIDPNHQRYEHVDWEKLAVTFMKGLGRPKQIIIPAGSRPIYVMAHTTGSPGAVLRFERRPTDGMLYSRGAEGGPGNDQFGVPFKLVANSRGDQLILGMRNNGGVVLERERKHGTLTETSWLPVPGTLHDNTGLESLALSPDDKYLLAFCAKQKKLFLFVPDPNGKEYKLADSLPFDLPDRDNGPVYDYHGLIRPGFRPHEFFVELPGFDCLRLYRIEEGK